MAGRADRLWLGVRTLVSMHLEFADRPAVDWALSESVFHQRQAVCCLDSDSVAFTGVGD